MEPHYTYILQSEKDCSYYIGCSKDPEKRLMKHNRPQKRLYRQKAAMEFGLY
jgi:putative endonuclease